MEVTFHYCRWNKRIYAIIDIKLQNKNANTFNDKWLCALGNISLKKSHTKVLNGHHKTFTLILKERTQQNTFLPFKNKHVHKNKEPAIKHYIVHLNLCIHLTVVMSTKSQDLLRNFLERSQNCDNRLLAPSRLSIHWRNLLKFDIRIFWTMIRRKSSFIKIWQERRSLYMTTYLYIW